MIVPIVEGHGESESIRILLERIFSELFEIHWIPVRRPIRRPRSSLVKREGIEAAVRFANREAPTAAILVLLDADNACPEDLGTTLREWGAAAIPHVALEVLLAKMEFEAWFLASLESLRGVNGVKGDAERPPAPEEIRDAKGWLERQMNAGCTYAPPQSQPAFTRAFSLEEAQEHSPSFKKLIKKLARLRDALELTAQ